MYCQYTDGFCPVGLAVGRACGPHPLPFRLVRLDGHRRQQVQGRPFVAPQAVRVGVHRQGDRRMTGKTLRGLRMNPGPCQSAYEGMPQAVKVQDTAGFVHRQQVR